MAGNTAMRGGIFKDHQSRVEALKQLILEGLPGSRVEVHSPDGVHFQASVVSSQFVGKSTVQQHRMVYDCLGDRVGREVHALSLQTAAPESDTG